MVYFIETDSQNNIVHVCCDPGATIVPLINRVLFSNSDGTPKKDANGNDLSSYGFALNLPVGITVSQFNTLMSDGIDNYTYDSTTETVVKKVVPDATKTA